MRPPVYLRNVIEKDNEPQISLHLHMGLTMLKL